jgi:dihydrofolate synthase/folylpolyglutamate synthase
VVEVGMGGRYDATNVIMPRVSVISTVHYDHMRVLGDTLEEIAYHKAGIIKPGIPAVIGQVPAAALPVITAEARRCEAHTVQLGREFSYEAIEVSQQGGRFSYRGLGLALDDLHLGLLGQHQFANASAALAAVELFADELGIGLDEAAIREGLARARFAGRLEVMQNGPRVVLDGAHNEEKINALIAAVPQVFSYERLVLVMGMLETKAADPITGALARMADAIVTTSPRVKGKPALPAGELAHIAREAGVREVWAEDEPQAALERALAIAGPRDLVVVTGSLYLIGMLRSHWHPTAQVIAQRTMFTGAS